MKMETLSHMQNGAKSHPIVSVVIPMRNEEIHVAACLDSLCRQTYRQDAYEILVVDGESSDRSVEIVQRFQQQGRTVRLLRNPARIVPTAMNEGLRAACGEFIVRADAHSVYPHDYIENCVRLLTTVEADNVGGPAITVPANQGLEARLVAAILSNPFGVGDSYFRMSMREGYVDTVPFGAFRKDVFRRIGPYDESLGRNEDNELNARIRNAGGRVFLAPSLAFKYFPPSTLAKLLEQTYRSATWHLFTLFRYKGAMGARHLIPALFVVALAALAILSLLNPVFSYGLAGIAILYILCAGYFVVRHSRQCSVSLKLLMPLAFSAFHLTYGLATLAGIRYLVRTPALKPTR